MSSIQRIERQSGTRYKAILKHGTRVLKTKTFTQRKLARDWLRRMEADREIIDSLGMRGARLTLRELAESYRQQWCGKDTSRLRQLDFWVKELGKYYLPDIDTNQIREVLQRFAEGSALRSSGSRNHTTLIKTNKARKPATINRMRATLSALFKYAMQEGYIKTNPVHGIAQRPEHNQRNRYLTPDEMERLLKAAKDCVWDRMYLLIVLAISTGARKSELLALRWQDIDFDKREAILHTTKNGQPRILTFPPPAMKALLSMLAVNSVG